MADLLRLGAERGAWDTSGLVTYVRRLLEAFPEHALHGPFEDASGRVPIQPPIPEVRQPLVEPLTRRELEVLHLICEGYSNQDIAEKLVVTLNTVKKHTSNIYGKLGVSSRTQAIAQAHQLGLVSPDV